MEETYGPQRNNLRSSVHSQLILSAWLLVIETLAKGNLSSVADQPL